MEITVDPNIADIKFYTRLCDVDDPSDHDGPVDTDPDPDHVNNVDNKATPPNSPWSNPYLSVKEHTTDADGKWGGSWDTAKFMQPGNNWRYVAGGWEAEVERVKPKAADDDSRLWYDKNNNDVHDQGEITLDEYSSGCCDGFAVTPRLTLWRKLHVERDSMGPVVGNIVGNHSGTVEPAGEGRYAVPLTGDPVEVNRFENGGLYDGVSYFEIESNTASEVIVLVSTEPPESDVDIELQDDDSQSMPEMPDLGLMQEAYGAAFIDFDDSLIDGGGDPENNKDTVAFQLNVADLAAQIEATDGLESHGNRSAAFWIAYVQNAYQMTIAFDNDPDSEEGWSGESPFAPPRKGSLVYLETATDVARECGFADEEVFVQRVVVHEMAHQFDVDDEQGPAPSIMHKDNSHDPQSEGGSQFNQSQQLTLRTRGESPGA